ncbi:MAG: hypothetical protein AB7S77_01360 [Desulfatirhabdiaceae bacterium]
MKTTYVSIAIAITLVLSSFFNADAQDFSGGWTGVITESNTNCKKLGKAEPGEYRLTFIQNGNELTAMENTVKRPYKGIFEEGNPMRIVVRGTYEDKGGYVTEEVILDFTSDRTGNGHSIWGWSDGWFQCGGSFRFSLSKDQ